MAISKWDLADRLSRLSSPKFDAIAILVITSLLAFVASVIAGRSGVSSMAVRYPLAIGIGYIGFLLLVIVWTYLNRLHVSRDELPESIVESDPAPFEAIAHFGGGVDHPGCFLILIVVILASLGWFVVALVLQAPAIAAELVLYSSVAAVLGKRGKAVPPRPVLIYVFWHTFVPVALLALVFALAGAIMQERIPEATTIGQFLQEWTK
jgi:hypothetical protein